MDKRPDFWRKAWQGLSFAGKSNNIYHLLKYLNN